MYDPVFLFFFLQNSQSCEFDPPNLIKTSSNMSLHVQTYSLEHFTDQFRMYVCLA